MQEIPSARVIFLYWVKSRLNSEIYARGYSNSFVEIGNKNKTNGQILTFYDNNSIDCLIKLFKNVRALNIHLQGTDFMYYESVLESLVCALEEIEEVIHCSVDDITSKLIKIVNDKMH